MNIEESLKPNVPASPPEGIEAKKIGVGSHVRTTVGPMGPSVKGGKGFGGVVESINDDGLVANVRFTVWGHVAPETRECNIGDLEIE